MANYQYVINAGTINNLLTYLVDNDSVYFNHNGILQSIGDDLDKISSIISQIMYNSELRNALNRDIPEIKHIIEKLRDGIYDQLLQNNQMCKICQYIKNINGILSKITYHGYVETRKQLYFDAICFAIYHSFYDQTIFSSSPPNNNHVRGPCYIQHCNFDLEPYVIAAGLNLQIVRTSVFDVFMDKTFTTNFIQYYDTDTIWNTTYKLFVLLVLAKLGNNNLIFHEDDRNLETCTYKIISIIRGIVRISSCTYVSFPLDAFRCHDHTDNMNRCIDVVESFCKNF